MQICSPKTQPKHLLSGIMLAVMQCKSIRWCSFFLFPSRFVWVVPCPSFFLSSIFIHMFAFVSHRLKRLDKFM